MKKTKLIVLFVIGIVVFTGGLFFLLSCASSSSSEGVYHYGGSDPEGDFITVIIDRTNSRVKHVNHTNGETEESQPWNSYTVLSATDEYANGFSIIKRVDLDTGEFVLFAEFPKAAAVYQKFDSGGNPDGNPVYVVYREQVDKTSFYAKAYTWLRFYLDSTGDQSDMSAGFAAFDSSGDQGLMYGAGYSKKDDVEVPIDTDGGVSDINESDTIKVDDFTADSATSANIMWTGGAGVWESAISMVGTASGAVVLDFGTDTGGGMGLAFPQVDTNWSQLAGTYFTMVYGFDQGTDTHEISPMKVVLDSSGNCKVFQYDQKTDTGTTEFDETFTAIGDFVGGPVDGEDISATFERVSGCSGATSTVVKNAYICKSGFIARDTYVTVVSAFDATGRFLAFTMFDEEGGASDYILRFGLGIRDTGYSNNY